ncbi:NAD(P)-dependent oxidoreductase [Aquabacterium humicola]|uniref:NAD(P)-dependent oxidoreductase n=1 Tax=Aquabacterium humicola TaxID=3237377 RepID=UPI0025426C89|nr:NAD(P)-dependent oxidoreductase [Rubrivivax pictus]
MSTLSPTGTEAAAPEVRAGRLDAAQYQSHFGDAAPRYSRTQALVEAERCLYCHDAPCATACPTGIDVPSFIRRIAEDNVRGAAKTILESNPLGGTCARVCPTELLCEQVCVRVAQQGKPVEIGRLQRYATDAVMDKPVSTLFTRAASTGKRIAVIGAGPAGMACAFGLARLGHDVVLHDARHKGGGLNEYGLASYKTAGGFAQRELDWLLGIGGITLRCDWRLESAAQLQALRGEFDAVYLAIGLGRTEPLKLPGEDLPGVRDAVDFIAELLQTADKSTLPIGRRIVVIGGGMTAVDAAVQSKLLGAEEVHMVYRRGPETMGASAAEQDWAQTNGVTIHHWLAPEAFEGEAGRLMAVRFARQHLQDGQLVADGTHELFAADMVFRAVGQKLDARLLEGLGLTLQAGRIVADDDGLTGVDRLWVGGDCRFGGRDLTVEAVEDGKRAAQSIHATLTGSGRH